MWVRSQNKSRLIKCDYITIDKCYVVAIHNESHNEIEKSLLGTYSSHEKVLKVLDKIQNFIGVNDVFQMPQDDEVE